MAYVALVALSAVMNLVSGPNVVAWYVVSVVLTLPWSLLAIYLILFASGAISIATGGDWVAGNAYSDAAVVVSFVAIAILNVALLRFVALPLAARTRMGRRPSHLV